MSVLRRDVESYQRALDQYQRQVAAYNRKIEGYNQSIVSDAQGNYYVVGSDGTTYIADKNTGKVTATSLPGGRSLGDYGLTSIEGDNNFRLLRQNPTQASRETVIGAYRGYEGGDEWNQGTPYYYRLGDTAYDSEGNIYRPQVRLGPEYRVDQTIPGEWVGAGEDSYRAPDQYRLSRDASTYASKPGAFDKKFTRTAPDPTYAQLRQMQQGTANQQALAAERGLISEVMRGGGVLGDRPQYAAYGQRGTPGVGSTAESMPTVTMPGATVPNVTSKPIGSVTDPVPVVSKPPGTTTTPVVTTPITEKPVAPTPIVPVIGKPGNVVTVER
jgi:hypothetical protein